MAQARRKAVAPEDPAAAKRKITSVFLVDDHPIVRHGLAQVIGAAPDLNLCGEAGDVATTLRQTAEARPDVVVVDLTLEDGSGLELIKQLKARDDGTRMLVTSMHDEELYAERALRAGAMGYLKKNEAIEKIVDAIRQVARGHMYLSDSMAERVMRHALGHEEQRGRSPVEILSDRELEVFELIGRGLTTQQIAKSLRLSSKTIDTHRKRIQDKLKLVNRNEILRQAVLWVEGRSGAQ